MLGLFIILLFYLTGVLIAHITGNVIPGSIIGMILLFTALSTKLLKPNRIKNAANFMLDNMMLFFVPVGVGLIVSYPLIRGHLWAIVVASLISTVLVVISVGIIAQKIRKRGSRQ